MGAWGVQFNENDAALDFLGKLEDSRDWNVVGAQLAGYVDGGGYEEGEEAFAAAEIVAAGLGRASARLRSELAEWASGHRQQAVELREPALKAADLLVNQSELAELWAEADEYSDWQATIIDLTSRLG